MRTSNSVSGYKERIQLAGPLRRPRFRNPRHFLADSLGFCRPCQDRLLPTPRGTSLTKSTSRRICVCSVVTTISPINVPNHTPATLASLVLRTCRQAVPEFSTFSFVRIFSFPSLRVQYGNFCSSTCLLRAFLGLDGH